MSFATARAARATAHDSQVDAAAINRSAAQLLDSLPEDLPEDFEYSLQEYALAGLNAGLDQLWGNYRHA